jgi:hypothetical protein
VHPTCIIHRATVVIHGPEQSPIESSDESWETEFPQLNSRIAWSDRVVRDRIELSTFR